MERLAILIPCYNEEITIAKVVKDARSAFPDATVYVYDNNSTDKTAELAKEAGAIVHKEPKQGKGNVIRTMFAQIDALCYLMVDGDDTYPMEEGAKLVDQVLNQGAAMTIGDRLSANYNQTKEKLFHKSGNSFVLWQINHLFGGDLTDAMTGFRAFSYAFAKSFPCRYGGFQTETEMSIFSLTHHLKVTHLPVTYRERPAGSHSKLSTVKDGIRVLRAIQSLHRQYHPGAYFGIRAACFGVLGAALFIPFLLLYLPYPSWGFLVGLIFGGVFLFACVGLLITALCLSKKAKVEEAAFQSRWKELSEGKK